MGKVVIYIVDSFRIPEDQELEILTMLYGEEAARTIMQLLKSKG